MILDTEVCSYKKLFDIAAQAVKLGIDIIQLRDKQGLGKDILNFSKRLVTLTQKSQTIFIVNDRADIALAAKADGVHLGQDDLPLIEARKILKPQALMGISCQTLKQALKAQREGADYIGFGSVFKTLTKPGRNPMDLDLLKRVIKTVKIPVFAIGGINLTNMAQLKKTGVRRIAVCRVVCESKNVQKTIKEFQSLIR